MARDNGNQQQMFLLVTDENQPVPVQINGEGHPRLLELSDPINHKNKETGGGSAINFYNEKGEIEDGVMLTDYHFFVDENNEVFSIPPGSIVQGVFRVTDESLSENLEDCDIEPAEDEHHNEEIPAESTIEDMSGLQSRSIDSSDVYVPMEDIELEEEIVSNLDSRDAHPYLSGKRDTRLHQVRNHNSEEKHGGQQPRRRKKRKSIRESKVTKDIRNKPADILSSTSNHIDQIDRLVEIAEAELLGSENFSQSSQCDSRKESSCAKNSFREMDSSMHDHPENLQVTSHPTDNVPIDLNSSKSTNQRDSHVEISPNSIGMDVKAVHAEFIKEFVIAMIDHAIVDLPERHPRSASDEIGASISASVVSTPFESIELSEVFPQENDFSHVCTKTSLFDPQGCREMIEGSHVPSNSNGNSPHLKPDADQSNMPGGSLTTYEDSNEIDIGEENCYDIVDSYKPSQEVTMSNPCGENKANKQIMGREVVDKEVQVELISNIRVIRVMHDWQQHSTATRSEVMSRDVARQKRELDALSTKLKAMERELEIRITNLRRDQSRLEMAKRSFDIERTRGKKLLVKEVKEMKRVKNIERKNMELPKSADKNSKVFAQSTYAGRGRKRKSEPSSVGAPVAKTPKLSQNSRGPKAAISAD